MVFETIASAVWAIGAAPGEVSRPRPRSGPMVPLSSDRLGFPHARTAAGAGGTGACDRERPVRLYGAVPAARRARGGRALPRPVRRPDASQRLRAARAATGRPAGQRTSLTAVTAQPAGPPRRVVIAEDEALIRLDLAEMLAEEGYDVVGQAGDGEAAVALAEEHRPDLVVLDVKMPRLDGIAAAQRIAEQRIAPVVILTAFSQRELVERARDAGAMAYVVKPFTKNDLVPAIEMAVSRYAEIQMLEAEVAELNDRLETRKAVERAK